MKVRALLPLMLAVPVILAGQAVRRRGPVIQVGESPAQPKPLGPTTQEVADNEYLVQSKTTLESYPMISFVHAPGYDAQISSWTTVGEGERLDYAFRRQLSFTLDLTSSYYGGPEYTFGSEVGVRWHADNIDRKINPFVDGRLGYSMNMQTYATAVNSSLASVPEYDYEFRRAQGVGAVAGTGLVYSFSRTIGLMSEVLASESRIAPLHAYGSNAGSPAYTMTQYRFALGFTYTPLIRRIATDRVKDRILK